MTVRSPKTVTKCTYRGRTQVKAPIVDVCDFTEGMRPEREPRFRHNEYLNSSDASSPLD